MNTGGPAFPVPDSHHANGQVQYGANGMTLLDWMAGQALAGFFGYISETQECLKDAGRAGIKRDQVSRECYEQAQAMLAEKARREATGKDCLPVHDHSPDAGKLVKPTTLLQVVANERDLALDRVIALADANKELVEALQGLLDCISETRGKNASVAVMNARAIIAKHKGAA